MLQRVLAVAVLAVSSTVFAGDEPLRGDAKGAVQLLLTSVVSAGTALTQPIRGSISAADTSDEVFALLTQYSSGSGIDATFKSYLEQFAINGDECALAAMLLRALNLPVNNTAATPETACPILDEAGVNLNGSGVSIVAQVLNNPVLRNAVAKRATQPVSPRTSTR